MAEAPYTSFADYLKRNQSKTVPVRAKVDLSKLKTSAGAGNTAESPQDPLSWLVDIVSRPLYGVTESIDSVLDAPEDSRAIKKKFDSGDFLGGVGESIAKSAKVASAPFRGLFSTDDEDKKLTSDLIEKGTDVVGKETNPSYVDEQDNVNPILKGVLGFVGDVALDPLTYVPGAVISSVLKTAGKGLKAGARGTNSVARSIIEASEAGKVARTPAKEALETTGARATEDILPVIDNSRSIKGGLKASNDADEVAATRIAQEAPSALGELMRQSAKLPEARKALDELSVLPKTVKGKKAPSVTGPDLSKLPPIHEWMRKEIIDNPTAPQATIGRESLTMVEAARVVGDETIDPIIRQQVKDQLQVGYDIWKEGVIPKLPKLKPTNNTAPKTIRDRFRQQMTNEDYEASVTKALGSGLFSYLKKANLGDARFESTIKSLTAMLDDTGMLDDFDLGSKASPVVRLLQHLGVENPQVVQSARADYIKQPRQKTNAMDEILSRIRDGGDPVARQASVDVEAVLPDFINKNFGTGLDRFSEVTNRGTLRTSDTFAEGEGRNLAQVNTHAQMELHTKLSMKVADRIDGPFKRNADGSFTVTDSGQKIRDKSKVAREYRKLFGPQRAKEFEKQVRASENLAQKFLAQQGFPIHVDEVIDGFSIQSPLSFDEIYSVVAATSPEAAYYVRMLNYNGATAIPVSRFMEAAVRAIHGEDPMLALVQTTTRYGTEEKVPNFLSKKDAWGLYGSKLPGVKPSAVESQMGARYVKTSKNSRVEYNSSVAREVMEKAFNDAAPALKAQAEANADAYRKLFDGEVFEASLKAIDELNAVGQDPMRLAAAVKLASEPGRLVKAAGVEGQMMDVSVATAAEVVNAAAKELIDNAQAAAAISTGAAKGGRKQALKGSKEGTAAQDTAFRKSVKEAEADEAVIKAEDDLGAPEGVTGAARALSDDVVEEVDFSMKWFGLINGAALKVLDPLARVFVAGYGMGGKLNLYRLKHSAGVLHKTLLAHKIRGLRELSVKYGTPTDGSAVAPLVQAFHALQKGIPPVGNAQVSAAYTELTKYMGETFGVTEGSIFGNSFFRNNTGIDYINEMFGSYNILGNNKTGPKGTFFDIDEAERVVKETLEQTGNEIDLLTAAEPQWREWDLPDTPQGIVDFISKLNVASIRMAVDVGVASSFRNMAVKAGLGSDTAGPGLVKMVDKSGANGLLRLLPDDFYVDKEIANAFHRMSDVMGTSQSIDGEIGKFVHNFFDPTQNAWKVAITIYRPGHHVRNFFGDESMTFLAEGVSGWNRSAKDAFKVMSLRNNYQGVDIMRSLNHLGVYDLPKTGEVLSTGKYGDITNEGILEAMMKDGTLPPAYVTEDVYIDSDLGTNSAFKKVMGVISLKDTKVNKAASGVSEYRDHYSRIKHYIQFVNKAQKSGVYKNREEMLAAAGDQIKKWHPDVSLLSVSEAKYLRRVIPFYSWFRGAAPAIFSSIVMNPARFNSFNKASYNTAVAMGVNPDSLSDPFPLDQMFPSFLTEQMAGPQFQLADGSYVRVNPGIASWDVLNMLGGAPTPLEGVTRGIAGSTSPLIRMPAEMLSGGSWGTGARINDTSDYLDSAIPGVNMISNLTGTSVTGSLVKGGVDPQFQHARGNKDESDQALSFLNYLSGLGIQNYSKPNYINFAEIEKRNREGEQRGF